MAYDKNAPLPAPTFTPNISFQDPSLLNLKGMYILGLDLSLNSTGYAILYIEKKNGTPKLVETGHINTNAKQKIGERLFFIENAINSILVRFPDLHSVSKEKGFSRFHAVTSLLNQVLGVCVLTIHKNNLEVSGDYPPKTVKKQVTNNGNASKQEVQDEVRKVLNLPASFVFGTDDESDACGTALSHLYKTKLVKSPY